MVSSAPLVPSRTTAWRHKKEAELLGTETKKAREYSCRQCKMPMRSAGHTQYKGRRYCPNIEGQIPFPQWLEERKKEEAVKKQQ